MPLKRSLQTYSSDLKINVAANFIGNSAGPLLSFVCIPFYLRFIGAEGYGLIGIFTSLQVILSFLDGGLSITLNRELASLSAVPNSETGMRTLVKTLGNVYWVIALTAGIIAVSLSSFMANFWVHPNELSRETIQVAFVLMSVSLVFQFPYGFYSGGLLGLQRHIQLNILRVLFAFLRSVGAICVLVFYQKTVISFFGWMLFVNILQALILKWSVWNALPKSGEKVFFEKAVLKKVGRFAGGITTITIIAAFLTQIDKLILSKSFSLSQMGYYTLSQTIAGMIVVFVVPAFTQSLFPQFNRLIISENYKELKSIYLINCRRVSYIIAPVSVFMCFFSYRLLLLYTKNEQLASSNHLLLSFFVIGFLINSTLHLPYNLALAVGYTKKIIRLYLVLLVIYIPLLYLSLLTGKISNSALAYVLLQLAYLILLIPIIQKKVQLVSLKTWYIEVILKPIIVSAIVIAPAYIVVDRFKLAQNNMIFILLSFSLIAMLYFFIEKKYNLFEIFIKKSHSANV